MTARRWHPWPEGRCLGDAPTGHLWQRPGHEGHPLPGDGETACAAPGLWRGRVWISWGAVAESPLLATEAQAMAWVEARSAQVAGIRINVKPGARKCSRRQIRRAIRLALEAEERERLARQRAADWEALARARIEKGEP